jgi:phage repressor protein C with HTH and peptisase S24 domain
VSQLGQEVRALRNSLPNLAQKDQLQELAREIGRLGKWVDNNQAELDRLRQTKDSADRDRKRADEAKRDAETKLEAAQREVQSERQQRTAGEARLREKENELQGLRDETGTSDLGSLALQAEDMARGPAFRYREPLEALAKLGYSVCDNRFEGNDRELECLDRFVYALPPDLAMALH